ncbi:hypothetical protein K2X33_02280 [bacterium]|nr:hypothetical protein [bacterium]
MRLTLALLCSVTCYAKDNALFHYPTSSESIVQQGFQNDFLRSDRAIKLHVARPEDACGSSFGAMQPVSPHYLENQAVAANRFYDWFLEPDPSLNYPAIIKEQHKISCVGADGTKRYFNPNPDYPYYSDSVRPGVFRSEIPPAEKQFNADEFTLKPEQYARLAKHGYVPATSVPQNIPGITPREEVEAIIIGTGPGAIFHKPAPFTSHFLLYQKASADAMRKVIAFKSKNRNEIQKDPTELCKALAVSYYANINWMPFAGINNSLFMAQVNTILRHFGLKPMIHADLDYLALSSPSEVFQKVFWEDFVKANPQYASLPTP